MIDMIQPVVDAASHQKALRRFEELWDAKPGSGEERELDALATLVDAYERRAFPIQALNPLEAIRLRCEQLVGLDATSNHSSAHELVSPRFYRGAVLSPCR
jgi:antitoxin component HigA of HigAB toxin-antitoxin module